jgi:hypothetical protein
MGVGLFLGCATASPPEQTPSTTTQAAKTAPTKKVAKKDLICESYKVTGSHIRKEVCRTKEQMDAEREQAEQLIRQGDRLRPGEGD